MIRRTTYCPGEYQTYLEVQVQKLLLPRVRKKLHSRRNERVAWFRDRFRSLTPGSAICLGARFGEEVEALQSLGWRVHGLDLAEHPPWVQLGDMNAPIQESFDLIYSNAFDHCWNPRRFLRNIRNALTADGRAMLHVGDGKAGAYESIDWDSLSHLLKLVKSSGIKLLSVQSFPEFYGLTTELLGRK